MKSLKSTILLITTLIPMILAAVPNPYQGLCNKGQKYCGWEIVRDLHVPTDFIGEEYCYQTHLCGHCTRMFCECSNDDNCWQGVWLCEGNDYTYSPPSSIYKFLGKCGGKDMCRVGKCLK